ncbi:DNA cytosine methyltransferase [Streptococcus suis]|uniref:DNA cytosine methyltransferase n=2 Tax=Streptococcus suis TaxID=1307 RepID=UPI0015828CD0|nr:DNA cytosine methyltransferase [Streptococcus suis]
MKFLDLFAGIGGFRLGMERAGHECVGFCEIDQFARKSYKAIHNTEGEFEFHDITRVTDESVRGIGRVDVICGGFPCQAFSIAGKRAGFEDTRGTLFFEIARFASILRPKYLFLENVTGLLNHDNGNTFETILGALDELGYDAEWQVFNSKNFGVPKNRERVFIIGHLRGAGGRAIFPFGGDDTAIEQDKQGVVVQVGNLLDTDSFGGNPQVGRIYDPNGISPCLNTMQGGNREPKIIQRGHGYNQGGEHDITPTLTSNSWQENNHVKVYDFYNRKTKDEVGTLTASGHQGNTKAGTFGILDGIRIRKLTPRECWRLQGFPDWAFDRAQAVNSNKQAGNSVTVNVIEAIARKLEETDE